MPIYVQTLSVCVLFGFAEPLVAATKGDSRPGMSRDARAELRVKTVLEEDAFGVCFKAKDATRSKDATTGSWPVKGRKKGPKTLNVSNKWKNA